MGICMGKDQSNPKLDQNQNELINDSITDSKILKRYDSIAQHRNIGEKKTSKLDDSLDNDIMNL